MLRIKPEKDKDATRYEQLVCDLVNAGHQINIEENEIGIFLENWYLKLSPNGKWRIE